MTQQHATGAGSGPEALRRLGNEAVYRAVFENAAVGMVVVDAQGRLCAANPVFQRMLGHAEQELLGRRPEDFTHPDDRAESAQAVRAALAGNTAAPVLEKRYVARDGHTVWARVSVSRLEGTDGPMLMAVVEDVSLHKLARDKLLRLAAAMEQTADCVAIADADLRLEYLNPAAERCTGFAASEVVGRHVSLLCGGANGQGLFHRVLETMSDRGAWQDRLRLTRKGGQRYEADASCSAIREEDGGPVHGYVAVWRDVDRRESLERRLRQAQRMEAVGTLAGGIAHDFNNVLAAIMGFAEIALLKTPTEHELVRSNLRNILRGSRRAADLVRQVLTFCRSEEGERRPLEAQLVVKESLKMLRASLPSTIAIRERYTAERVRVLADPAQVQQVVMNLCANAAEAMEEGGTLDVRLDVADPPPDAAGSGQGRALRLRIADTGRGMDPQTLERAFDPYFTTRAPGRGAGMGLAIVHSIVQGLGGDIRIRSRPGQGAGVTVLLPLHREEEAVEEPREWTPETPAGKGRILVVDDEEDLAECMAQMLLAMGYEVRAQTDSRKALAAFREDPVGWDLLVTDQTMPRMTGLELARAVTAQRPDLPVVLCTGYGETLATEQVEEVGTREVLYKPLVMSELAQAVGRCLRSGGKA
jgi:PAS domain S-box-containing protein